MHPLEVTRQTASLTAFQGCNGSIDQNCARPAKSTTHGRDLTEPKPINVKTNATLDAGSMIDFIKAPNGAQSHKGTLTKPIRAALNKLSQNSTKLRPKNFVKWHKRDELDGENFIYLFFL